MSRAASVANWERKEITRAVCCAENEDRANRAEAKLAAAVKVLRAVDQCESAKDLYDLVCQARDALAAIEETKT